MLTFIDPDKIRELARRGEALETSDLRQMPEHARWGRVDFIRG
jgi:hypothetical protein